MLTITSTKQFKKIVDSFQEFRFSKRSSLLNTLNQAIPTLFIDQTQSSIQQAPYQTTQRIISSDKKKNRIICITTANQQQTNDIWAYYDNSTKQATVFQIDNHISMLLDKQTTTQFELIVICLQNDNTTSKNNYEFTLAASRQTSSHLFSFFFNVNVSALQKFCLDLLKTHVGAKFVHIRDIPLKTNNISNSNFAPFLYSTTFVISGDKHTSGNSDNAELTLKWKPINDQNGSLHLQSSTCVHFISALDANSKVSMAVLMQLQSGKPIYLVSEPTQTYHQQQPQVMNQSTEYLIMSHDKTILFHCLHSTNSLSLKDIPLSAYTSFEVDQMRFKVPEKRCISFV